MAVEHGWTELPLPNLPDYEWNLGLGLVRSWRRGSGKRRDEPRTLVGSKLPTGYRAFGLLDRTGRRRSVYWHELVCAYHHGPRPAGMEVCHGDGDCQNNSKDNLRWGTSKENKADMAEHGRASGGRLPGERNAAAKLTAEQVLAVRAATGASHRELARRFGISRPQITNIRAGHTWKHLQTTKEQSDD